MKPQTLNDIFFAIVRRKQERVMLVTGRHPSGFH